jgi:hypothetical protein
MATPYVRNKWIFDVNNRLPCNATIWQQAESNRLLMIWQLKEKLKTVGWSVSGSRTSSTGAIDGVDRWISSANLMAAAWIILQHPSLGQIMISSDSSGFYPFSIHMSPKSLYTWSGSLSSLPSAVDQVFLSSSYCDGGNSTYSDLVWHMLYDVGQTKYRIIIQQNNINYAYISFEILNRLGVVGTFQGSSDSDVLSYTRLFTTGSSIYGFAGRKSNNDLVVGQYSTYMYYNTNTGIAVGENYSLNEISGEIDLLDISATASGSWCGRCGIIEDVWASTTIVPNGTTYPHNVPYLKRKFIQFGSLVFPWNGIVYEGA